MVSPWRMDAGQKAVVVCGGSGSTGCIGYSPPKPGSTWKPGSTGSGRVLGEVQIPEFGASYSGCPGSVIWQTSPAAHGVPCGLPRVAEVEQRAFSAAPPPLADPPEHDVGEVQARPSE